MLKRVWGALAETITCAFRAGIRAIIGLTATAGFSAGVVVYGSASLAQDESKAKAGLEVWKLAGCSMRHGPFADGNNQNDDYPMGANLRATRLDAAGLKLTISCGRPGTGMPSFDEGAYELRACYGRPLGDAPSDLYPAPRKLNPEEIDAVIAYLRARIIGRGEISRAECVAYYEGYESELCQDYK
jgi:hypothetical protein